MGVCYIIGGVLIALGLIFGVVAIKVKSLNNLPIETIAIELLGFGVIIVSIQGFIDDSIGSAIFILILGLALALFPLWTSRDIKKEKPLKHHNKTETPISNIDEPQKKEETFENDTFIKFRNEVNHYISTGQIYPFLKKQICLINPLLVFDNNDKLTFDGIVCKLLNFPLLLSYNLFKGSENIFWKNKYTILDILLFTNFNQKLYLVSIGENATLKNYDEKSLNQLITISNKCLGLSNEEFLSIFNNRLNIYNSLIENEKSPSQAILLQMTQFLKQDELLQPIFEPIIISNIYQRTIIFPELSSLLKCIFENIQEIFPYQ